MVLDSSNTRIRVRNRRRRIRLPSGCFMRWI